MKMTGKIKDERVNIRLDSLSKQKLEKAAGYLHVSLSNFLLLKALESAEKIIEDHEQLSLNEQDWQVFFDALDNPGKPNKSLEKAFSLHHAKVKSKKR